MNIESVLIDFAQIAVVLIGFSSVFLTFLMRDMRLDPVLRMHARALIMVAPLALILSILPFVLMGFGLNLNAALRWALFAMVIPGSVATILNNYYFLQLSKPDRRRTGYAHMALANSISLGVVILFVLSITSRMVVGGFIGVLVLLTLGSVLALFTSFIDELRLFRAPDDNKNSR